MKRARPGEPELLGGVRVQRLDIPKYLTNSMPAIAAWSDWKRFGLPYGGGYMAQPAVWCQVMRVIEAESAAWQEQQQRDSRGTKTNHHGRNR